MIILGLTTGHDASAALFIDGVLAAYCKEERLTRKKQDAGRVLRQRAIGEVLRIGNVTPDQIDVVAMDRGRMPARCFRRSARPLKTRAKALTNRSVRLLGEMTRLREDCELDVLDANCLRRHMGLRPSARVQFVNHHYSHALGAFQFTDWEGDALYVVCDAAGDGTSYAAYGYDGRALRELYGGDDYIFRRQFNFAASIGIAYSQVTEALGFRANRHEGKITGLAAFGKPVMGEEIRRAFRVSPDGSMDSRFPDKQALRDFLMNGVERHSREDMAASIQYATEQVVVEWVQRLLERFPARYVGMSGGVFANVRLNQHIARLPGIEEVFVFPAMGDEGLSVGNCVDAQIRAAGLPGLNRYRLTDVYLGRAYGADDLLGAAWRDGFFADGSGEPAERCAELLAEGLIGAIFSRRMEMGPRALGARSILASPVRREVNDTLNRRLERTEFMPFAPYVSDQDAERVFDIDGRTRLACRFMTITADVRREYRDRIPAVVHVDQTARPQIVERAANPLYYDILQDYKKRTGVPCLINTSFNAHEEPIINAPGEALKALGERRIDFLVSEEGLVFADEATPRARAG